MTMEIKIRHAALRLVKVRITRRRRSKRGFVVHHPPDARGEIVTRARTRAEALAVLLAKVRCANEQLFEIREATE